MHVACTHSHPHVRAHTHTHIPQKVKGKEGGKRGKKEKVTLAKRKCHPFHPMGAWMDERREGGTEDGEMEGWRIDAVVWTLTF